MESRKANGWNGINGVLFESDKHIWRNINKKDEQYTQTACETHTHTKCNHIWLDVYKLTVNTTVFYCKLWNELQPRYTKWWAIIIQYLVWWSCDCIRKKSIRKFICRVCWTTKLNLRYWSMIIFIMCGELSVDSVLTNVFRCVWEWLCALCKHLNQKFSDEFYH